MIPQADYVAYRASLNKQVNQATRLLRSHISGLDFSGNSQVAANQAANYARELIELYGNAASYISAVFYEQAANRAGQIVDAQLEELDEDEVMRAAMRAADSLSSGSSVEAYQKQLEAMVQRYILQQANKTSVNNAVATKTIVKYARVPTSANPCAFCIMLASRGFVYASKESAGEMNPVHEHCSCIVVSDFGEEASLEGYDESAYRELWEQHRVIREDGSVDWMGTINSIRREQYPEIKDERNARRRALYAQKKAQEQE